MSRTARWTVLIVVIVGASACKKSDDALLVVSVSSRESSLPGVKHLGVTVLRSNTADPVQMDDLSYPSPDGSTEISKTAVTLGVKVPSGTGDVIVRVRAYGDKDVLLASGSSDPVTPHGGTQTAVSVILTAETSADGGTSDGSSDGPYDWDVDGMADGAGSGGSSGSGGGGGDDGAVATGGNAGGGTGGGTDGAIGDAATDSIADANPTDYPAETDTDVPVVCGVATAPNPVISDFATGTTAVSMQVNGGTDVWVVTPQGTATVIDGEMHAQTTGGNFAAASTVIGKGMCVDVSKYTGIRFKIRSATNTALLFVVLTPETSADFSGFRKAIAVTPTNSVVSVAFADLAKSPFGAGMTLPDSYKPATRLLSIYLGVGAMTEKLDIFLDDVTFY